MLLNLSKLLRLSLIRLMQLLHPFHHYHVSKIMLETRDDGLFLVLSDRTYRIRGLDKNASTDQLKVQLMVQRGEAFFIDKLDLYSSKRQMFINQACVELGVSDDVIKKDLGKLLLALEQEQLKKNDSEVVSADKHSPAQSVRRLLGFVAR